MTHLFHILAGVWAEHAKRKDFNAVIDVALASYLLFRTLPDTAGPQESALGALYLALETVLRHGNPPKRRLDIDAICSFCGRKPPEVRLGAGPDVFICEGCVNDFTAYFHDHNE